MSKKRILTFLVAAVVAFTSVFFAGTGEAFAVEREVGTTPNIKYPYRTYALKIMLDAGHYGSKYNKGVASGYYESNAVWTITEEMEKVFSEYYDVKVGKTRTDKGKDLDVVERGKKAKGYDLFVSNHTNAINAEYVDYPLVIIPFESKFYSKMYSLGSKIGYNIEKTIGTSQKYQVRTETYGYGSSKKNSYGVIRGASYVGVPGIIVEHSFHTNKKACKWLNSDTNLKKLARKNAETIAAFYGARKSADVTASFTVKTTENKTNIITIPNSSTKYSYEIYCALQGETLKKLRTIDGNGGSVSFEHKKPYRGRTVYYVVRPVSSKIVGKYSKAKGALIKDIGAPVISAEQTDQGVVKISWKNADSAEKYTITKKCGDEIIWQKTYGASRTSCLDPEAEDGVTYTYQVKAWATDGTNEYVRYSKKIDVTAEAKLEPVQLTAVSKEANAIRLSWEKDPSATKYIVYMSQSANGEYKRVATRIGGICTVKNLETDKKYYFKVKSVKSFEEYGVNRVIYSGLSDVVSCRVMIVPPAKVSSVSLSTTKGKVTAKWNKVSDAAGYRVAYGLKGSDYKYVNTTSLSRTFKSLKSGKTYRVKVRAYKKTGEKITYGSWSSVKTIKCK